MDLADVVRQAARQRGQQNGIARKNGNQEVLNEKTPEASSIQAKDSKARSYSNNTSSHQHKPAQSRRKSRSAFYTTEAFDNDESESAREGSGEWSGDQPGYFDSQDDNPPSSSRQPQTPMRGPFFLTEVERGSEKMRQSHQPPPKTPGALSRQSTRSRVQSLDQPQNTASSSGVGDRFLESGASSARVSADQGGPFQGSTIQEEPAEMEEHEHAPFSQSMASRFLRRRSSTGMLGNQRGPTSRGDSGGTAGSNTNQQQPSSPTPFSAGFFSRPSRPSSRLIEEENEDESDARPPDGGEITGTRSIDDHHQGGRKPASKGWQVLRARVKHDEVPKQRGNEISKGLTGTNMVTELTCGHLPVMMLKMAMDRDEHNVPRVPVLLNYLKLRITDSIYPFSKCVLTSTTGLQL